MKAAKPAAIAKNMILPNFAIIAKKPTFARTFPATNPPIVHAATVSVSASKDKNGLVHVSLVNIDPNKNSDINLDLGGAALKQVTGRILASAHLQDYNSFESPDKIKPVSFNGASLKGNIFFEFRFLQNIYFYKIFNVYIRIKGMFKLLLVEI